MKHTITNISFYATTTEQHGVTEPLSEPEDRCSRSPHQGSWKRPHQELLAGEPLLGDPNAPAGP